MDKKELLKRWALAYTEPTLFYVPWRENKEIAVCTVRYKDVPNEFNKEITSSVSVIKETPSNDFLFASSVVEFGLLLRNSKFKADASYDSILSRINKEEFMNDPYKKEFYELVKMAKEYIK